MQYQRDGADIEDRLHVTFGAITVEHATKAEKGTIRGDFGTSIERNASHGSDAVDTAAFETAYFFAGLELV